MEDHHIRRRNRMKFSRYGLGVFKSSLPRKSTMKTSIVIITSNKLKTICLGISIHKGSPNSFRPKKTP